MYNAKHCVCVCVCAYIQSLIYPSLRLCVLSHSHLRNEGSSLEDGTQPPQGLNHTSAVMELKPNKDQTHIN